MSWAYTIGIAGAGGVGSALAHKMACEGLYVILFDFEQNSLSQGIEAIKRAMQESVEKGIISQAKSVDALSRITRSTSFKDLAQVDLVVDTADKDHEDKLRILEELGQICDPKTIIASTTKGEPVSELAIASGRPDRFIGLHYISNPAKNRLVEIIPHLGTSRKTIEKARVIARVQGKTAILTRDVPGFAINRLFIALCAEALRIHGEGLAGIATIEEAARRAFYYNRGPFEQLCSRDADSLKNLAAMLCSEDGIYCIEQDYLETILNAKAGFDSEEPAAESKMAIIIERLYASVFYTALRLIETSIAESIEDVDRGTKIGLRWRYGPFELMNRIGINEASRIVRALTTRINKTGIPAMLTKQQEKEMPFEFRYVDLQIKGELATLTINRPEAMNALNREVIAQMSARLTEAENNPDVKAILIEGAGSAFVAGADIKYFVDNIRSDNLAAIYIFTRQGHDLFSRLEESPKLTVAIIDGLSLGSGSEMALACQAIIATPEGSLGFPETAIGLFPGLGGMIRLERHLKRELTKYYVFTGDRLSAEEARELGIVNKLVERTEIEDAVTALVKEGRPDKYRSRSIPDRYREKELVCSDQNVLRLLNGVLPVDIERSFAEATLKKVRSKAPIALRMANELIDQQSSVSLDDAIELEMARLFEIFSAQDTLTGLKSLNSAPPVYRGY